MKRAIVLVLVLLAFAQPAGAKEWKTFLGYVCQDDDCLGHRRGFVWARNKNIGWKSECEGNSASFMEGCFAWVESQGLFPATAAAPGPSPTRSTQCLRTPFSTRGDG